MRSFTVIIMASAGVLITLVAYEPASWIDSLLSNLLSFCESGTVVMMHLNVRSRYAPSDVARWNSTSRIGVASTRVAVGWDRGSLLYAHLTAAAEGGLRWPSARYVVLQASNMMWIRPGMEAHVRRFGWSFETSACPRFSSACGQIRRWRALDKVYAAIHAALPKEHRKHAWHYHEGAFVPINVLLELRRLLHALQPKGANSTGAVNVPLGDLPSAMAMPTSKWWQETILNGPMHPVERWLPLFALNYTSTATRLNSISRQVCHRDPHLNVLVSGRCVSALLCDDSDEHARTTFAVKRVVRDPNDSLVQGLASGAWQPPCVQRLGLSMHAGGELADGSGVALSARENTRSLRMLVLTNYATKQNLTESAVLAQLNVSAPIQLNFSAREQRGIFCHGRG